MAQILSVFSYRTAVSQKQAHILQPQLVSDALIPRMVCYDAGAGFGTPYPLPLRQRSPSRQFSVMPLQSTAPMMQTLDMYALVLSDSREFSDY